MKKICLIISCMIALFVLLFISENYNNKRIEAETTRGTISTTVTKVLFSGAFRTDVDTFGTDTSDPLPTGDAENFTLWVKQEKSSGASTTAIYWRESITYDRKSGTAAEWTGTSTIVVSLAVDGYWHPYTISPSMGGWLQFMVKGDGIADAGTNTVQLKLSSK
ncbi:hypothetical protein LCGC14_1392200 [marine sediment metagenome]|uniref:Uncharacterized protein n=1 Tax=marine sediment metagenome TaxID=412755 RepID=A0A0F9JZK6_9ZZZZ